MSDMMPKEPLEAGEVYAIDWKELQARLTQEGNKKLQPLVDFLNPEKLPITTTQQRADVENSVEFLRGYLLDTKDNEFRNAAFDAVNRDLLMCRDRIRDRMRIDPQESAETQRDIMTKDQQGAACHNAFVLFNNTLSTYVARRSLNAKDGVAAPGHVKELAESGAFGPIAFSRDGNMHLYSRGLSSAFFHADPNAQYLRQYIFVSVKTAIAHALMLEKRQPPVIPDSAFFKNAPHSEALAKGILDRTEDPKAPRPEEEVENRLLSERINAVLAALSEEERPLVALRYGLLDGYTYTLDETAQALDTTTDAVKAAEKHAIEILRRLRETNTPSPQTGDASEPVAGAPVRKSRRDI